jgi:acetyl esterase/lipase
MTRQSSEVGAGIARALLTALIPLCAVGFAFAQSGKGDVLPLGRPIPPPAEEGHAIRLPLRTPNAAAESWEQTVGGVPTGAKAESVAVFDGDERWVRNVSTPTLSVFRPDASRSTGVAFIVAPGGGFMQLAIDREGYSPARWLNERGITAFVLKYRLAPMPGDQMEFYRAMMKVGAHAQDVAAHMPSGAAFHDMLPELQRRAMIAAREDGLEAVHYVRTHAAKFGISPDRIGMLGFSAGATTVIGVVQKADAGSRPDAIASIYGLLPDKSPLASPVPAFIAVADDDPLASGSSLAIYRTWRSAQAPVELHVFAAGGHGFGVLHQGKSSDQWLDLFDHWLRLQGFESSNTPKTTSPSNP